MLDFDRRARREAALREMFHTEATRLLLSLEFMEVCRPDPTADLPSYEEMVQAILRVEFPG